MPRLVVLFAVALTATGSVYQRLIALDLQLLEQTTDIAFALPNLLGGLLLSDQAVSCFLQCDQTVALPLRHEKCS